MTLERIGQKPEALDSTLAHIGLTLAAPKIVMLCKESNEYIKKYKNVKNQFKKSASETWLEVC